MPTLYLLLSSLLLLSILPGNLFFLCYKNNLQIFLGCEKNENNSIHNFQRSEFYPFMGG